jgi:hypothetical protein
MASISIFEEKNALKSLRAQDFGIFFLKNKKRNFVANDVLPFRIKLTNIGIASYGPGNAAPIGIAIVGYSNYVM